MKDITDVDYYAYAIRVCNNFEIKNIGEYHDLIVQSDTLLLADVFKNFRNMCNNLIANTHIIKLNMLYT